MFLLVLNPPPPILRLNIAYFAVAEGWLLLDIGWFVLFLTCSYDEMLRFKASAASAAAGDVNSNLRVITDSKEGLIQAVADNYDANISSQNGLKSTHALALLLTQEKESVGEDQNCRETIKRISKEDMKKPVVSDVDIKRYHGPKKTICLLIKQSIPCCLWNYLQSKWCCSSEQKISILASLKA